MTHHNLLSFTAAFFQLVGICISGYGLKKSDSKRFAICFFAILYSLLHFFLGLVLYSNPIASNKLRWLFDKSVITISCLFLPVLNMQLFLVHQPEKWLLYSHITFSLVVVILCLFDLHREAVADSNCIINCSILLYLCLKFDSENYWLLATTILLALNHFMIRFILTHYSVPKIELFTVSLIFNIIFLVNSIF